MTTSRSSQFVRASDLAAILGVSKSTIWRWRAEGKLPDPFRLSSRVTVWELKEVLAFVEQKRDLSL
ncbi:helix-turn-helix domain-containing protein [uncultured Mailhella sp.]|uniref:helix-turn-helix transcriptional regulator n=1 Tax=uncultured Mailhella sp. TaxID=1981031 RepID=UPI003208A3CF